MSYLPAALLCLATLATACKKTPPIAALNGTYSGIFQRQYGGSGQISRVSLIFSGDTWTGTSQFPKYPGLCNGTFRISSDNKIIFTNACFWTTEFDSSLVLSQEYELSVTGSDVEMVRINPPYRDVYKLSK